MYLSSIHEAISLIALPFVGYTILCTLSFLSVALKDSAQAPTQPRSGTPHGRTDTIGLQVVQELLRCVLTASVGVKDCHTFLNRTPLCCHVDGLAHQRGAHMIGHRVPHDLQGVSSPERSRDK